MENWLLVHCKPKEDHRAEKNLESQGYKVYRPKIKKAKPGKNNYYESLFPRYLFISLFGETRSYAKINSTYGVSCLVRFGMEPATVSNDIINYIMEMEKNKNLIADHNQTTDTNRNLKEGDKITVNGCGFENIKAIFSQSRGEDRSMILLDILGKHSKITVPTSIIHQEYR